MAFPPPPRRPRDNTVHLTPFTVHNESNRPNNHPYGFQGSGNDSRSSSTQSLRPEGSVNGKRTLLLIYIHGFLGNETSFKSFPAHVHNLLMITLSETHVIHSKIYPRYKSRKPIEYARDDFSNWLCPHESPDTDIVLLGHSLGGILGAEVALLSPYLPHAPNSLRHRILGMVAFDTPFLGMHPSVVGTGIMSLFHSNPERNDDNTQGVSAPTSPAHLSPSHSLSVHSDDDLSRPPSNDPNFNPSFANDVRIPQRSGIQKALYFVSKHSGGLTSATKEYVLSHLEFGGCLADYPGLQKRYKRIRALEDVDEHRPQRDDYGRLLSRVRFVNYYSASTGRRKLDEPIVSRNASPVDVEMRDMSRQSRTSAEHSRMSRSPSPTIRISSEIPRKEDELIEPDQKQNIPDQGNAPETNANARSSLHSAGRTSVDTRTLNNSPSVTSEGASQTFLPEVSPLPDPPPPFDETRYTDKDELKLARKEYARQVKAFERSQKDRDKCLRDREKLARKREKAALKEQQKHAKIAKQNHDITRAETLKRQATLNPELYDRHLEREAKQAGTSAQTAARKKQRDRKFCALPPKAADGSRDEKWVRVYMDGVDEVVAHTTLFEPSETYEKLVGDTAARIEEWVNEERTMQLLQQERGVERR